MTRHERIQKMNIEEMAEFLLSVANDCTNCCTDCNNESAFVCPSRIKEWLKSEHKEKINLSEAERVILENIDKDYKWIARDKNGTLYVYEKKPQKDMQYDNWDDKSDGDIDKLYPFNHLFQFITWEDEQAYNIEELLKN